MDQGFAFPNCVNDYIANEGCGPGGTRPPRIRGKARQSSPAAVTNATLQPPT